jgi:NAD dependent epimerase/dehydratase family enzyme
VDDLVGMFRLGLADESLKGVFNAVSPGAIRHREMTQKIARAMHKPLLLPPIPGFLLRLALGEMACLVLGGNLVSADKIQKDGKFTFTYTRLEDALKGLLHG